MLLLVCNDSLKVLVSVVKTILGVIQIAIPIALIVLGTIDLGKAVIASKEDDIKKNQGILIKRVIAAVLVFLVATIVTFAMGLIGGNSWKGCWNEASCKNGFNSITGSCYADCTAGTSWDSTTKTCITD